MPDPYLSEIKIIGFGFAPRGWALCNGQLLPINQNQALFALLGTTYGGDGRVTFGLPDLRGRAPVHAGGGEVSLGERSGQEAHTLTLAEIPQHTHVVPASNNQATAMSALTPPGNVLAVKERRGKNVYATNPSGLSVQPLNPATVGPVGGGQAHSNMQPLLVLNFVIALQGVFPSPNP